MPVLQMVFLMDPFKLNFEVDHNSLPRKFKLYEIC